MFGAKRRRANLTIFFATDVHGSDVCFRKFLSAQEAYGADELILGGDMTGKLVIPLVPNGSGYRVNFAGQQLLVDSDAREDMEQKIRNAGFYPIVLEAEEAAAYSDRAAIDELFIRCMTESLERWNAIATRRGFGDGSILVAPGNDDPEAIDPVLERLSAFRMVEGQTVQLVAPDVEFSLVSCGYSNRTPWQTPREMEEDRLLEYLRSLVQGVDSNRTILNAHVPPWDSGLDTGPDIDPHSTPDNVQQRKSFGNLLTKPVGSRAVRQLIEEFQPLVSLHGHIHESRGGVRIGRSLCLNPGSDYGEGVLRGALVRLGPDGVVNYQLTSG